MTFKNCTNGICNNLCAMDIVHYVPETKEREENLNQSIVNFLLELKDLEKESAELAVAKPEYSSYFKGPETGIMRSRVALEILIEQHGLRRATVLENDKVVNDEVVILRG